VHGRGPPPPRPTLPRTAGRSNCCAPRPFQPPPQHNLNQHREEKSGAIAVAASATHTASQSTRPARDLDIVLCHSTADFDSLAAAVGLAKLRGPDTIVVVPGGEAPSLNRFLTLHRQLYRISDTKPIDPRRLRWVGVVDTCRRERLGVASEWPAMADTVLVYDHHMGRECDVEARPGGTTRVIVEPVGAVATLICEELRASGKDMTPAEATLLALAIHSDTGMSSMAQRRVRVAREGSRHLCDASSNLDIPSVSHSWPLLLAPSSSPSASLQGR
jgi:hypothetical protein